MYLPPGMTESEVVEVIYKVVNTLAKRFRFGYHSVEDMKQEGARFGIEALNSGSYDPTRPLENFLYTHIRNRLINYKRNNYIRNEPPCNGCVFFDPKCKKSTNKCAAFQDTGECKKLSDWKARNSAKQSLMRPMDVSVVSDKSIESDSCVVSDASFVEIKSIIDKNLPVDLRSDYLRMLDGVSLPKVRRDRVREAILSIQRDFDAE